MKHQIWSYRNGHLVVEKFTGVFNFDQIRKADKLIIGKREDKKQPILVLSDLSKAIFPQVEASQIQKVFKTIDNNLDSLTGMKMAILANSDLYEEFVKVNSFAIEATKRPISVMVFHTIGSAANWLEISPDEQTVILEKLLDDSTSA